MLFATTQLDTLTIPDGTPGFAAWDISSSWPFEEPNTVFSRRLEPLFYTWLRNRIEAAIEKFGNTSPQVKALQRRWNPIKTVAENSLDMNAWDNKHGKITPDILVMYVPPITDTDPETVNTAVHDKYLFHPSDWRSPQYLRGYWKKVDACAFDLAWSILGDALQVGWEKEHILRNVGSLPWPGMAWPNEYGLVCKLHYGDRIEKISRSEIVIRRRSLNWNDTYTVSYPNPAVVLEEELKLRGIHKSSTDRPGTSRTKNRRARG